MKEEQQKMFDECMRQIKDTLEQFEIERKLYEEMPEEERRVMLALKIASNPEEFRYICENG